MKKKEALRIKLIRRFYGINGDYDEYKEKEVNKIGNNAFMILFWYLILSSFVAFLFGTKYPIETLWTYLGLNIFFLIFVISPYTYFAIEKRKLLEVDVKTTDLKKAKRKTILTGIYSGLIFTIGMFFLGGLIEFATESNNVVHYLFNFRHIVTSILEGLFFGGFTCLIGLQRFYKIDGDKED